MGAFLAALPAFIASLPYVFQATAQLMSLVGRLVSWAEKNDLQKWIDNLESRIDELEQSKTTDDKLNAARNLANVLKSFG